MGNVHTFLLNSKAMNFKNATEDKVRETIENYIDLDRIYEPISDYGMYLNRLKRNKVNSFFYNVPSPHLTPNGNNKRTEMSLHCPELDLFMRLECKHQDSFSDIVRRGELELTYAKDIPEKVFALILEGKAFQMPYVLSLLAEAIKEKNLTDKVWFGNIEQFKRDWLIAA